MRRFCCPAVLLACGLAAVLPSGCEPAGPKLYPVRGTVTVKGKPAAHAVVFLHRKGRTDMAEPVPYGKAGDDGKFVVTTNKDGDGAQTGEYVLTVFYPDMTKQPDGNGQRPDLLNGAYEKPGQTKLAATVKPEENTIPPIDLTPGPPRKVVSDPNNK